MKYIILLLLFVCFAVVSSVFWFEQQWFTQYTETSQGISFSCTQQCFILLWNKWSNDSVTVKWIQGQGQMIVWALGQNWQLIPLGQQNIVKDQSDYVLIINSSQGDIPTDAQLWVVFVGSISAVDMQISLWSLSFWDKIIEWWRGFWLNEWQTFYGINLRYGHKIWSTSVVIIWYRVVVLTLIVFLFLWRFRFKNILYVSLVVYLLIAVRNQIDYSVTTKQWLQTYVFASSWSKVYGNLWDYYEFIDRARWVMRIEDKMVKRCRVYLECTQERPFCAHMNTVFMKPCEPTNDITQSDYQIYYKKSPDKIFWVKLLEFNNSFVYKK